MDAPGTEVVFERLAVTEQQIADYQLPTAPPKAGSPRRSSNGWTTTSTPDRELTYDHASCRATRG
ncbi:hypothetical protein [Streptomyces sp. NPDC058254]|uniref:hypothetical protein n=1 Tax=Streptomyces sp. NPDC058254 TaxID=3346406 RepID=UPI0036F10062